MSKTAKGLLQISVCACPYPVIRWEQKTGRWRDLKRTELSTLAHCKLSDHLRFQDLQKEDENSRLTLRLYSFTHCKVTSSFRWYPGWLMGRHDKKENFEPDVWGSDSVETPADSHTEPFISDPFSLNFGQLNFLLKTTPKSRQSCVVWLCWDSFFSTPSRVKRTVSVGEDQPAIPLFSILVLQIIKSSGIFPFCWDFVMNLRIKIMDRRHESLIISPNWVKLDKWSVLDYCAAIQDLNNLVRTVVWFTT